MAASGERMRPGLTGTRTSRADLVTCLAVGEPCLKVMAPRLGFHVPRKVPKPPEEPTTEHPRTRPQQEPARVATGPRTAAGLGFWKVIARRRKSGDEVWTDVPRWFQDARPLAEHESVEPHGELLEQPPAPPSLVPAARLWPFLRWALGEVRPTRRLDERLLLRRVSKGRPIDELPCKSKLHWSRLAQVIVDRQPRLALFWDDFSAAIQLLVRVRGPGGLRLLQFDQGPEAPCRDWFAPFSPPRSYQPPPRGTPVLVMGDLGCYAANPGMRRAWLRFGRFLQEQGVPAIALLCLPARLWHRELDEVWTPVFWDRGLSLAPRNAAAGPDIAAGEEHGVHPLLSLLAPSVRVEPELLRAARFLLPPSQADVGSEYHAWFHPHTVRDLSAMAYLPSVIPTYRAAFRRLAPNLRNRFARLLSAFHARLPFSIRDEEGRIARALSGMEREPARPGQLMARVARSFHDQTDSRRMRAWFARLSRRQDPWSWRDVRLAAAYLLAKDPRQRHRWEDLPAGFPLDKVIWVLGARLAPAPWTLFLQGRDLRVCRGEKTALDEEKGFSQGQWLAWTSSRGGALGFQHEDQPVRYLSLTEGGLVAMPEPSRSELKLHTDSEVLRLRFQEKPPWADQIGYTHGGLFLRVKATARRVFWLRPGHMLRPFGIPAEGSAPGLLLQEGRWVDEAQFDAVRQGFLRKPAWADEIGLDELGIFALLQYRDVVQRMRFIPPGEFQMGGPEREPQRHDDETRHSVILTRGFWLGETPVTQALWQRVMKGTPSNFKGPDRPVESVSWQDTQGFIRALNRLKPALRSRLPTEAEWEYACRAGTETPFHFGRQITPDQVNYDGNHPYAGGEKGAYRQETVAVYALPGNDWGLYQMHGNVWEWCSDWYGEYQASQRVDPRGPESGGVRVPRGGGWFDFAGYCRSAYRNVWLPTSRGSRAGVRLAAGHPDA